MARPISPSRSDAPTAEAPQDVSAATTSGRRTKSPTCSSEELEALYDLEHVECPRHLVERLAYALQYVDARLRVKGCDILRIWVEHHGSAGALIAHTAGYPAFDMLLNPWCVTPSALAHEYGHFLDSMLGLRGPWQEAVKPFVEYTVWRAVPQAEYWAHPGEMFARYVEQLCSPRNYTFEGEYSYTTFNALLPTFQRLVTQ